MHQISYAALVSILLFNLVPSRNAAGLPQESGVLDGYGHLQTSAETFGSQNPHGPKIMKRSIFRTCHRWSSSSLSDAGSHGACSKTRIVQRYLEQCSSTPIDTQILSNVGRPASSDLLHKTVTFDAREECIQLEHKDKISIYEAHLYVSVKSNGQSSKIHIDTGLHNSGDGSVITITDSTKGFKGFCIDVNITGNFLEWFSGSQQRLWSVPISVSCDDCFAFIENRPFVILKRKPIFCDAGPHNAEFGTLSQYAEELLERSSSQVPHISRYASPWLQQRFNREQ